MFSSLAAQMQTNVNRPAWMNLTYCESLCSVYVDHATKGEYFFVCLNLSYFRTYIYVRNPKTVATPVRIYTYTDFAIEMWGFYRRLTDTLRYHPMSCSRASGLRHPLVSMFTKSEEK